MRVLAAPDKFRDSLTAAEAADAITAGVRTVWPSASVAQLPVADGGEGSLDACLAAGFSPVRAPTVDPLGVPLLAAYARRDDLAVVELAQASGLALRGPSADVVRHGSTYGAGLLVRHAFDAGARTVVVAVGGSATVDGGTGLATALGVRFLDASGAPVPGGGAALSRIARIDTSGVDGDARLMVVTDVDVPLSGPRGAARLFGPQKGAEPADVSRLEAGLAHLARLTGTGIASVSGAGAAGGVPVALSLLGAQLRPGAGFFLDLLGFDEQLRAAELVITGEGHLDAQTLAGKAPAEVARRAVRAGRPVVLVAGRISIAPDELGATAAAAIADLEPDPRRQLTDAAALLTRATAETLQRLR